LSEPVFQLLATLPGSAAWRGHHRSMTKASALVTGSSSGIGREIAQQLAAAGLTVYVGSRDQERGRRVAGEIGGGARLLALDVTDYYRR
jgi:NAD(P)-dependent dehydrogenase (short-subunit alcohol dehydrogenase family)